jgi:hypothetical protein
MCTRKIWTKIIFESLFFGYSRIKSRTGPRMSKCTDRKDYKIFLIHKKIQMGAVAKSYMRKGFLIYEEMHKYLVIYEEAVSHLWLFNRSLKDFLIMRIFFLFFISGNKFILELLSNTPNKTYVSLVIKKYLTHKLLHKNYFNCLCTQYFHTLECTTDDHCPGGVCNLEACVGKLKTIL